MNYKQNLKGTRIFSVLLVVVVSVGAIGAIAFLTTINPLK